MELILSLELVRNKLRMSSIVTLTDTQKRIQAALAEKRENDSQGVACSIRELAKAHDIPKSTLYRYFKSNAHTPQTILQVADGRGRKQRLGFEDERMISDAISDFQSHGTPLDRDSLKDLVQTYVQTLPESRQKALGFRNQRLGDDWVRSFMKRQITLTLKTRVNLAHDRTEAMNPENVATHFARIRALCNKHNITDGCFVFNLDESGFSIRGMTLGGRSKCIVARGTRGNTREPKFQGTCDHVTVMPVVSATGQVYTPVVVLPGVEAKYRKRPDGSYETPADFLPSPNYLFYISVAGMDGELFYKWALNFVEETAFLRRNGNKLLVVYDGHGSHLTYKSLQLLKENNIVVAGLPAHSSHVLQPLDVGVFGPYKEKFRCLLSRRSISTTKEKDKRNDIFTVCELLTKGYYYSITAQNIMSGFRRSGLWNPELRGPDPHQIRADDFTSSTVRPGALHNLASTRATASLVACSDDPRERVETYKQLCVLFLRRGETLCSDGAVLVNGSLKVSTTSGATLTSDNVIAALKEVEKRKVENDQRKEAAQKAREERKVDKEILRREKEKSRSERDKARAEKEEFELQKLKHRRESRRTRAGESSANRRRKAKLRCIIPSDARS